MNELNFSNDQRPLEEIATPELSYIGDVPYHWTLIRISDGDKTGHVRIRKNEFHHFSLDFIGIERPVELDGWWTYNRVAVRALHDYCAKHGWTLDITHISRDRDKILKVNLKTI